MKNKTNKTNNNDNNNNNNDEVIDPNPTTDQLTFAKALASPDKSIRDKTVVALKRFLHNNNSNNDMNELEMLKLWKALYYCYWLSDKVPIQQELALVLTTMFHNMKNINNLHLYIRSFFKTIIREWGYIDQHRINKFYTLLRFMIRELFNYMKSNKWSSKVCDDIFTILNEDILNKVPNGPRYQIVDVYLEELMHVTNGDIDTTTFLKCIEPFTKTIGNINDNIYLSRVIKGVFIRYINDYAVNVNDKTKKDDDDDDSRIFYNVSNMAIQKIIFDIAADDNTLTKNRDSLYQLHQEFPTITGRDFVDDDDVRAISDSSIKAIKKSTSSNTNSKTIKNNSDDSIKKSGTTTTTTTTGTTTTTTTGTTTTTTTGKRKVVEENVNDDKKTKKSKVVSDNTTTTTTTTTTEGDGNSNTPFIESKKFSGRKQGYKFQKGPKGLGYYIDSKQTTKSSKAKSTTELKKKVHWGGAGGSETAKSGGASPSNALASTPTSTPKKTSTHKATPAKRK